ncbi:hypothetical protein ADUPG1_009721 [Aduncisulcus paluster]|uniref:Uncharacterized protein n=1 Tax=Aduncisulcus paluster TaxID=2918883 RepID=A0ABQ5KYR8_9EUKA|nr:hypothetical protein ADUPG1_009721 [Aduncisulcus paluster]
MSDDLDYLQKTIDEIDDMDDFLDEKLLEDFSSFGDDDGGAPQGKSDESSSDADDILGEKKDMKSEQETKKDDKKEEEHKKPIEPTTNKRQKEHQSGFSEGMKQIPPQTKPTEKPSRPIPNRIFRRGKESFSRDKPKDDSEIQRISGKMSGLKSDESATKDSSYELIEEEVYEYEEEYIEDNEQIGNQTLSNISRRNSGMKESERSAGHIARDSIPSRGTKSGSVSSYVSKPTASISSNTSAQSQSSVSQPRATTRSSAPGKGSKPSSSGYARPVSQKISPFSFATGASPSSSSSTIPPSVTKTVASERQRSASTPPTDSPFVSQRKAADIYSQKTAVFLKQSQSHSDLGKGVTKGRGPSPLGSNKSRDQYQPPQQTPMEKEDTSSLSSVQKEKQPTVTTPRRNASSISSLFLKGSRRIASSSASSSAKPSPSTSMQQLNQGSPRLDSDRTKPVSIPLMRSPSGDKQPISSQSTRGSTTFSFTSPSKSQKVADTPPSSQLHPQQSESRENNRTTVSTPPLSPKIVRNEETRMKKQGSTTMLPPGRSILTPTVGIDQRSQDELIDRVTSALTSNLSSSLQSSCGSSISSMIESLVPQLASQLTKQMSDQLSASIGSVLASSLTSALATSLSSSLSLAIVDTVPSSVASSLTSALSSSTSSLSEAVSGVFIKNMSKLDNIMHEKVRDMESVKNLLSRFLSHSHFTQEEKLDALRKDLERKQEELSIDRVRLVQERADIKAAKECIEVEKRVLHERVDELKEERRSLQDKEESLGRKQHSLDHRERELVDREAILRAAQRSSEQNLLDAKEIRRHVEEERQRLVRVRSELDGLQLRINSERIQLVKERKEMNLEQAKALASISAASVRYHSTLQQAHGFDSQIPILRSLPAANSMPSYHPSSGSHIPAIHGIHGSQYEMYEAANYGAGIAAPSVAMIMRDMEMKAERRAERKSRHRSRSRSHRKSRKHHEDIVFIDNDDEDEEFDLPKRHAEASVRIDDHERIVPSKHSLSRTREEKQHETARSMGINFSDSQALPSSRSLPSSMRIDPVLQSDLEVDAHSSHITSQVSSNQQSDRPSTIHDPCDEEMKDEDDKTRQSIHYLELERRNNMKQPDRWHSLSRTREAHITSQVSSNQQSDRPSTIHDPCDEEMKDEDDKTIRDTSLSSCLPTVTRLDTTIGNLESPSVPENRNSESSSFREQNSTEEENSTIE